MEKTIMAAVARRIAGLLFVFLLALPIASAGATSPGRAHAAQEGQQDCVAISKQKPPLDTLCRDDFSADDLWLYNFGLGVPQVRARARQEAKDRGVSRAFRDVLRAQRQLQRRGRKPGADDVHRDSGKARRPKTKALLLACLTGAAQGAGPGTLGIIVDYLNDNNVGEGTLTAAMASAIANCILRTRASIKDFRLEQEKIKSAESISLLRSPGSSWTGPLPGTR